MEDMKVYKTRLVTVYPVTKYIRKISNGVLYSLLSLIGVCL
jgi:hypothetical protein